MAVKMNFTKCANIKMAQSFQEKGLEAHPDKAGYIVFGSKGYKEDISKQGSGHVWKLLLEKEKVN